MRRGAALNAKNNNSETPLHKAVFYYSERVVKLLVDSGANINVRDYEGRTPLAVARKQGFDRMIEILLKHGARE